MKMKQPLTVVGSDGSRVVVDISDEACMRFSGLRYGMKIIDPDGDEGMVVGVAPGDDSKTEVLWYRLEDTGNLVYWDEVTDLVNEGFRVVGEPEHKCSGPVTYATRSRIIGKAGSAGYDVAIVRNEIAREQYNTFKEAGYTDIRIEVIRVLIDEDDNEYLIKKLMPLNDPAASTAISAQYRAEHINPGINVYDYDWDVLKKQERGIAWIILAVMISVCMLMLVVMTIGKMVIIAVDHNSVWGVVGAFAMGIVFVVQFRTLVETITNKITGISSVEK